MTTRLHADAVLDHPLRNALYDTIRREPGIAFLQLFDRFRQDPLLARGLGFGSLGYHLDQLERFGLITTRKSGRHRRHYENGGGWNGHTTALAVLQAESVSMLCRIVAREPGLNQWMLWQRVATARACTRQSISYHLHRLERHGLVQVVRRGSAKNYLPTTLLERLMPYALGAAQPLPAS